MREKLKRLLPVRSDFSGQDRIIVEQATRWRSDARFLALLISSHLKFDFMRKNRRVEPIAGTSAYNDAAGRLRANPHHAVNILA
ncbi:MAG: hypothetical protein ACKOC1_12660 [Hyphomicrobiales bacterium]